jgi:hypothetical protein
MRSQNESAESKDTEPVVAGVANHEIARANADAVRIFQVSGSVAGSGKTWHQREQAGARIETP